jgi:hypothetical protein
MRVAVETFRRRQVRPTHATRNEIFPVVTDHSRGSLIGLENPTVEVEHPLRPLFSFFQARTLPIGVYASERDFTDYSLTNAALRERVALAVNRALPWLRDAREPVISTTRLNAVAA